MEVKQLVGYPIREQMGANDVVTENGLVKNMLAPSVLVTSESDLANLPTYPAGTIFYTAGFKKMWQLDASGDYISMI